MQIKHMICDTVGAFLFLGEVTGQGILTEHSFA